MPDYCTIFAKHDKASALPQALRSTERATVEAVESVERSTAWIATDGDSTVRFNPLVHQVRGDKFSRIVFGAYNAAKAAIDKQGHAADELLNTIAGCKLIIGIVAEPELDGFAAVCISNVAEAVGGVVFNGEDFMDPNGSVLLSLIS